MLTGDSPTTAEAVAKKLGIEEFEAGVLPGKKSEVIRKLPGPGPTSWRWQEMASTMPPH